MIKNDFEKLEVSYRYIKSNYFQDLDLSKFKKILYKLDVNNLHNYLTPFTWVSYYMIDEDLINNFKSIDIYPISPTGGPFEASLGHELDIFSYWDFTNIKNVCSNFVFGKNEIYEIDHIEILNNRTQSDELNILSINQYNEFKENHTLFREKEYNEYLSKLKVKIREHKINRLDI